MGDELDVLFRYLVRLADYVQLVSEVAGCVDSCDNNDNIPVSFGVEES